MDGSLSYKNVSLRPLEPEDLDILYLWENDLSVWKVSNTLIPFSKYTLRQFIQNSGKDIFETKQLRLIIENNNGIPVGAIDLFDFDCFHQRAGVGILIYNNEDRQKGYAYNALILICQYASKILSIHQLYANISIKNQQSTALFKKAGFQPFGIKKEWIKTNDGWEDEIFFQKIFSE